MNKIKLYKKLAFLLGLISCSIAAQNQSKTFEERFNVSEETILEINTSHTDIEFKTWNKNEVLIEATIELTDVSKEDAESLFENNPIEILGNSTSIKVSSTSRNRLNKAFTSSFFNYEYQDPKDFNRSKNGELIELVEMPPLPNVHFRKFDYNAYKNEGEAYMKQWQKEFSNGFDKEYEKNIEEWGKRMEERAIRFEERNKEREQRMEEWAERMVERTVEQAERQQEFQERRGEHLRQRAEIRKHRDSIRFVLKHNDSIRSGNSSIFYYNPNGGEGNIKVKKTIRVKMPKSVKLKMNVKHGEVTLAENTININATLSHANLVATTINGDETIINASYTPVSVLNWNFGLLRANYSDNVELNEVQNLILKSNSSEIKITKLINNLVAENSFGPLHINSIAENFSKIDVSLKNAELNLELPNSANTIIIESVDSKINTPESMHLNKSEIDGVVFYNSYHLNKNNKKSIGIKSIFSEVILY
ncbi:hypothetical protein GH721_00165 [Kriegella sp. EG-1]|nr:hypothetical protein [Flavobacteriaceae bacterium EG-1]